MERLLRFVMVCCALALWAAPALLRADVDGGIAPDAAVDDAGPTGTPDAGPVADAGPPPADAGASAEPDDEEEADEEDEGLDNGDWDDDLPTPDDPRDVNKPRGYAPDEPQPFLTGGALFFVQYAAALGARGIMGALGLIPVIGLVPLLLAPLAESVAILTSGDRLGAYRGYLVFLLMGSYFTSMIVDTVGIALVLGGLATTVGGAVAAVALFQALPTLGAPLGLVAAVGVPTVGVGLAALLAGVIVTVLNWQVISPAVSIAVYHLAGKPKRLGDNGTGLPRLLPSDKVPRIPFFKRDTREEEEEEERREKEGRLPVSAPASSPPRAETAQDAPAEKPRKKKKRRRDQAEADEKKPAPRPTPDQFAGVDPPEVPTTPAPWVKSPVIQVAQVAGGYGLRALVTPCLMVPLVGPALVLLAGPPLEAYGVTWTGDRLGDGRTALLVPLLTSMAVGGGGVILMYLGDLLVGTGAVAGAALGYALPAQVPASGLPPWGVATLGGLAGVPVIGLGVGLRLAGTVLVALSPVASMAAYQLLKERKAPEDNGTDQVGLLPGL